MTYPVVDTVFVPGTTITHEWLNGVNDYVNESNPSDHSAANVTYNPPFTGAVATNVEAKLAQTVSVKDFGAVGDGVTDDTAAIQDAISAANGASVLFPVGTYLVTSTLNLPTSTSLIGDTQGFVYGPTSSKVSLKFSGVTTAIDTQGNPYVYIKNITIDGNNDADYGFVGGFVSTLESVNIVRCNVAGLYLPTGSYTPQTSTYNKCSFNGNLDGAFVDNAGTQYFHDCVFRQNTQYGFNGTLTNSNFHNCIFESNTLNGANLTGDCSNTSFYNGYFEQNDAALAENGSHVKINATTNEAPVCFNNTNFASTTTTKVANITTAKVVFNDCSYVGDTTRPCIVNTSPSGVIVNNSFSGYQFPTTVQINPKVQVDQLTPIVFSTVSDYIDVSNYATTFGVADFAVSATIQCDSTATTARVIFSGDVSSFKLIVYGSATGTQTIGIGLTGSSPSFTSALNDIPIESPVNIIYTRYSGTGSLYVNGVFIESFADSLNYSGMQKWVASDRAATGLQGKMYYIGWKTAALTYEQVVNSWRCGGNLFAAGLLATASMNTENRPSKYVNFVGSSTNSWRTLAGSADWANPTGDYTTSSTVGAAGAASALPANPVGYQIIYIGGTAYKVPYYNV